MGQVRLTEATHKYLTLRSRKVSKATLSRDRHRLASFSEHVGRDCWMSEVTQDTVETYFYSEGGLADVLAPNSFNVARSELAMWIGWCRGQGWIIVDIMAGVDSKPIPEKQKLFLSPPEMMAVLDAAKLPRDRAAIALGLHTGLRASDVKTITLGDVDLDAGWLDVSIQKVRVRDRKPITAELDVELRRWLAHYQTVCGPLQSNWFLIPSMYYQHFGPGGTPAREWRIRPDRAYSSPATIVTKALATVGLPSHKQGFHTLRRSSADAFRDLTEKNGHDGLSMAQQFLNHKSRRTTEIYLNQTRDRVKRDEMLRGKSWLSDMITADNVTAIGDARDRQAGEG